MMKQSAEVRESCGTIVGDMNSFGLCGTAHGLPFVEMRSESMISLCRLLHHNQDLVVDHNSACSVYWLCYHGPDSKYAAPLLVRVDKYDCAKALRFFANGFFRNTLGGQRRSERIPTSAIPAAYLLDALPHFALYTRRWILERTSRWQDIILQDRYEEGGLWDIVPNSLSSKYVHN